MNLEKLEVVESLEETIETRKVTVTFSFDFIDGEIQDLDLKKFYDLIKPVEPPEEEDNDFADLTSNIMP